MLMRWHFSFFDTKLTYTFYGKHECDLVGSFFGMDGL